ncbi:3-hydroxyacyl-CoA dehydrogenase family protein [Bacillus anthracis]|uniref:3-hydroxyacyl-CoA dehydrogenase family protein n=1 Tax=Bacillus anthracis TaxID=1392 RepID=UPI003D253CD7
MNDKKVAVIGIGAIGRGVVHSYALAGCKVWAVTRNGEDKMTAYIENEVEKGRLSFEQREMILSNVLHCKLEELPKVGLVIEAIVEDVEEKQKLFSYLDETQSTSTVLASSTSTIPISKISSLCKNKDRIVGMHFSTPVPIMELVEVIRSVFTSEEILEKTMKYCELINKVGVVVKDFPGFVVSRLAQAMINEAAYILMQGIADAEAIDTIAKLGLNVPIGPLKLVDQTGIDVALNGMESMRNLLGDQRYTPCPLFRQKVYDGHLGRKVGCGFYNYEK